MGTTLTALQNGSTRFVYVAAIEGYDKLLTSGDPDAAVTAWAGTDWTSAHGGLFVEWKDDQRLDPNEPFTSAGSLTLSVVPLPGDDTFGVATARRATGDRTYLDASLDCNDTTATVKSTADFDSSGHIHIGTECIAYTGKTSTTFTGLTRGKYSPSTTASGGRFAHRHRVTRDANLVKLNPVVSEYPRIWLGRWVYVYMHREVGGVLDTKAEAHCIFKGRIDELRDDPETFARVIHCRHVMDVVKEATVGGSLWEGDLIPGVYLEAGMVFDGGDYSSYPSGLLEANSLTVVSSGASGANQVNEGWYTDVQLVSLITNWMRSEKVAGRLNGVYSLDISTEAEQPKTKVYWQLGTSSAIVKWRFEMPSTIAAYLGYREVDASNTENAPNISIAYAGHGSASIKDYTQDDPARWVSIDVEGADKNRIRVRTRTGTVTDQWSELPGSVQPRPLILSSPLWGAFTLGGKLVLGNIIDNGDGTIDLKRLRYVFPSENLVKAGAFLEPGRISIARTEELPTVRQVFLFGDSFSLLVQMLLRTTGTSGFNDTDTDALPTAGVAIPYDVCGADLTSSLDAIPGSAAELVVFLEKPIQFAELLRSDFLIRWAFLYFANGSIKAGTWRTPTASLAEITLTDSNKAESSGAKANQRSAAAETRQWHKPISRIRYNRDSSSLKSDDYQNYITFEDAVAVDDMGGEGEIRTLSLRNTYEQFRGTGTAVESLMPRYLALMPLISRPANLLARSLDFRYFFQLELGDVVLFTDPFARDPETGTRGITNRPALITKLTFSPGGLQPGGGKTGIFGEVELFFTDSNTDRAGATYAPSADVDITAFSAGFSGGYNSTSYALRCYEHRYSESTEAVDASHFEAGDKIRIRVQDPQPNTAPVYWDRTIDTVSGNDIFLTTALSSPAWDNNLRYVISSQTYSAAQASQIVHAYQGDEADGLIESTAQPYLYTSGQADVTYTANTSTEFEIPPTFIYTDGMPRDVAGDVALAKLTNYLIDYKTAIQSPLMWTTAVSNTNVTGTSYKLVDYCPIWLSYERLTNSIYRYLTVSPWARSTDGTSTKIRVTLLRYQPTGSSLTDIDRGTAFSSAEWTGITSTTWSMLTADELTINVKQPFTALAFLAIELGYKCETRGIGKLIEGIRQFS